jgi:predicted restriction endonuclease
LPPRAGRLLLEQIDGISPLTVEEGIERAVPESTERRALILSRVGQGQFREDLMRVWNGRCAVTGLDLAPLLRASHIKPWRDSDNRERLDPYNGLLLSPSYDAALDSGLISFAGNGETILTSELTPPRVEQLGISTTARISGLDERHRGYLRFHRENVFRG